MHSNLSSNLIAFRCITAKCVWVCLFFLFTLALCVGSVMRINFWNENSRTIYIRIHTLHTDICKRERKKIIFRLLLMLLVCLCPPASVRLAFEHPKIKCVFFLFSLHFILLFICSVWRSINSALFCYCCTNNAETNFMPNGVALIFIGCSFFISSLCFLFPVLCVCVLLLFWISAFFSSFISTSGWRYVVYFVWCLKKGVNKRHFNKRLKLITNSSSSSSNRTQAMIGFAISFYFDSINTNFTENDVWFVASCSSEIFKINDAHTEIRWLRY